MGQPIVSAEQIEDRLSDQVTARSYGITEAIQAASDMIWVALGSRPGDDFAYATSVVERHRHRGGPVLYLRRRPVVSVAMVRYYDLNGDVIETLGSDTYALQDPDRGMLTSWQFPDTRSIVPTGYEYKIVGRPQPLLEVTYTGGWVTRPQFEADSSLSVNIPSDLEEACMQQAIYLWRSRHRDRAVANRGDEASSVGFNAIPRNEGGLLPEVAAVCRRYKRSGEILG